MFCGFGFGGYWLRWAWGSLGIAGGTLVVGFGLVCGWCWFCVWGLVCDLWVLVVDCCLGWLAYDGRQLLGCYRLDLRAVICGGL